MKTWRPRTYAGSGLSRVCAELARVCEETQGVVGRLGRPHRPLRCAVGLGIVVLLGTVAGMGLRTVDTATGAQEAAWFSSLPVTLQIVESGVNDLVFLGVAVWFLMQLEVRWKRTVALGSLRSLRALAHIVDMHQLTKDPVSLVGAGSPDDGATRTMRTVDLTRYLDDCSDAVALIGKVAALHVQGFDDAETLAAVGDIENLSASLAQSIRQKIATLDQVLLPGIGAYAADELTSAAHRGHDPSSAVLRSASAAEAV